MLAGQPGLAAAFDGGKQLYEHRKFDIRNIMAYVRYYNEAPWGR
jgi:hypothetical protein